MMTIFGNSSSQSRIFAIGNHPSLLWNSKPKKIGLAISTVLSFIAACYIWQTSSYKMKVFSNRKMLPLSVITKEPVKKERQTKLNWFVIMIAIAKTRKFASSKTPKQEVLIPLVFEPKSDEKDLSSNTEQTFSLERPLEASHQSKAITQNSSHPIDDPTNKIGFSHPDHVSIDNKIESQKQEKKIEKITSKSDITLSKSKALAEYKHHFSTCKKVSKTIIFKDIKQIKPQGKNYDSIDSVVGLMLYVSDLTAIDLLHEKCIQVILDTIQEGDKETSLQLISWLGQEKTFHIVLWQACVQIFIDKAQRQAPFNSVALERLIKIYKDRSWHQLCNSQNSLIVPLNHSLIKSALSILNENDSQNEKIKALNKWITEQLSTQLK